MEDFAVSVLCHAFLDCDSWDPFDSACGTCLSSTWHRESNPITNPSNYPVDNPNEDKSNMIGCIRSRQSIQVYKSEIGWAIIDLPPYMQPPHSLLSTFFTESDFFVEFSEGVCFTSWPCAKYCWTKYPTLTSFAFCSSKESPLKHNL